MGDEGESGVKNLKKWVTLFMDGPSEWQVLKDPFDQKLWRIWKIIQEMQKRNSLDNIYQI